LQFGDNLAAGAHWWLAAPRRRPCAAPSRMTRAWWRSVHWPWATWDRARDKRARPHPNRW